MLVMQIELVLTAATLAVAIVGSIAGIFGMNLNNNHEDSHSMFLLVSHSLGQCIHRSHMQTVV